MKAMQNNERDKMKKTILIFVVVLCALLLGCGENNAKSSSVGMSSKYGTVDVGKNDNNKKQLQTNITLNDVRNWYIQQIPRINTVVENSLKSNVVFSNGNIVENKFYFGNDGGWYDCHYTVWYDVNIQGVPCEGEMRLFLKYNSDNIVIWSHSVFVKSTRERIYREYDEKYEQIIEDYYKHLVTNYK